MESVDFIELLTTETPFFYHLLKKGSAVNGSKKDLPFSFTINQEKMPLLHTEL